MHPEEHVLVYTITILYIVYNILFFSPKKQLQLRFNYYVFTMKYRPCNCTDSCYSQCKNESGTHYPFKVIHKGFTITVFSFSKTYCLFKTICTVFMTTMMSYQIIVIFFLFAPIKWP